MFRPANEIREEFLSFFEGRGHRRVKSASVVPDSDPTLMFVNAGMVPFKRTFLGEDVRDYNRATTSQKCIRVSGKHNDLENVGRTPRHHTFFEMMGNFSFGDYFKESAIDFAWELLTEKMNFPGERLAVSVFLDDDEAYDHWAKNIGIPADRLYRLDEKENFWSMGDTGPCGPCSEIHYDYGRPDHCTNPACDPSCECGRWIELWNLVFMQFNRDESGTMHPLPSPSIDTGGGLERWAAVLQGKRTTWESDVFTPLIQRVSEISGVALGEDPEKDVSLRVAADHARTLAIMIGDDVLPSNAGRGYVLRRILRRGSRHGVLLGLDSPFLHKVADAAVDELGGAYPDLIDRREFILDRIERDESRFLTTLSKGLALLEDEIDQTIEKGEETLAGDTAFKLYDTYGFPLDLTEDILRGREMDVDHSAFDLAMQAQRERARAAWVGSGDEAVSEMYVRIAQDVTTQFRGYESGAGQSNLVAMLVDGEPKTSAQKGDSVELVFEETPFYAESGGQVGDTGDVTTSTGRVEIRDTVKPVDGLFVHVGEVVEGEIHVDSEVDLVVDEERRRATVRNHSGTHLLHAALREVLGPQAMQKGSLVGPNRLRFDFTHDEPVTASEIEQIEDIANGWIEDNSAGTTRLMSYEDAVSSGAVAIFDEKYGDEVRVVSFGDCSTELCGGTHAQATGDIGLLKVISEGGIASGIRRIEAQTGLGALAHIRGQESLARQTTDLLKVPLAELPARVEKLLTERRDLEKELEEAKRAQRGDVVGELISEAQDIDGTHVLASRVDGVDAKGMRDLVDELRNRLGSAVVLLVAENQGKVLLAVGVTRDRVDRFKAGDLVREVAQVVGGGGGGRPDFAQAGGQSPEKIPDALEKFQALCEAT